MKLKTSACFFLALCMAWAEPPAMSADSDLVVGVTGGLVRGRRLPEARGAAFRGIPFAAPPVGDLRWREPMPVISWQGIREADQPGPPPAQPSFGWNEQMAADSREDCLYLDVWTPTGPSPARNPVMVWIHGGANTALAGGYEPIYDGRALIGHGVVLVVIDYRLGIFGFFAHPALTRESPHHAAGNYGLLDQIAALQWVRDNIAKFGGDPGNVTIFGQSAGSWDIMALMSSPLARGLFHRAIAESGVPPKNLSRPLREAEQAGVLVADKLHAPAQDPLAFLRSVPPAELLKAGPDINTFTIDDWVLSSSPNEVWLDKREAPVPLIIGSNAVEIPSSGSIEDIKASIRDTFGDLAPKALALYGLAGNGQPAVDPLYGDLQDQWGSDLYFRCPSIIHGEWHQAAGNRVWQYEFDRAIAPHPRVQHSSELPYVFGNFRSKGGMVTGEFTDADRKLSTIIQAYWTNFAKTGNPNGPGLPQWPDCDGQERKYLVFTTTADVLPGQNEHGAFCDLFRELMNRPAAAQ
ncbi:MAG: carboxylesterase family protein [Opitutaceae bacterium]|nr:carboxylesterase family protein [Opitutaceae bacterium]